MGYSTSRATLAKRLDTVHPLRQGQNVVWTCEIGTEQNVAYKIREALYIAALYPEEYPELAKAHERFKIEIVEPGKIQAVPKTNMGGVQIHRTGTTVQHGKAEAHVNRFNGPHTVDSVIEAWISVQPTNSPLHFPGAKMSESDLERLHRWASQPNRNWLIFYDDEGNLTLRKHTQELDAHAWRPGR